MEITIIGWITVPLILGMFFMSYEHCLLTFIVFSSFTTVTAINIGNNSINVYYFMLCVCLLRTLIKLTNKNGIIELKRFNLISFFVIYATLSLMVTPFVQNKGVIIHTIEGVWDYVKVGLNQYTQLIYLIAAYACYVMLYMAIIKEWISYSKIEKALDYSYLIVLILGLLQLVIPIELVNITYRYHSNASYTIAGARISSTFLEPSMLSLFVLPLFIRHVNIFLKDFNLFSLLCICMNIAIVVQNSSSSFYVGLIIALIVTLFIFFCNLKSRFKINRKRFFIILLLIAILLIIMFFMNAYIYNNIILMLNKLFQRGNQDTKNSSGAVRMEQIQVNMKAFLKFPITGVGWGECRSTDLFTTLLVNVGLLGTGPLFFYIVKLTISLWKIRDREVGYLIIAILSMFGMMLVSVPELYYFLFWIYLAMAESKLKIYRRNANNEIRVG
ncbi:MAG: O-antigen ligase family protein [Clostridiales bacterium]|nr:O-antigen ligase family protein [Clostridiales bacterium]